MGPAADRIGALPAAAARTARLMEPAARSAVAPFYVMRVLAAAARRAERGEVAFNLAAGQPSTAAPKSVLAAAHHALHGEILGYTETPGIAPLRAGDRPALPPPLRDGRRPRGRRRHHRLVRRIPARVPVRVRRRRPRRAGTARAIRRTGTSCTPWGVRSSTCHAGRRPGTSRRLEMIDGLELDGLVVASPANPTGTMLEPAELAALARHCAATGVRLISDEIYHGITYTGLTSSSWETDRSGFVVNSFSKYFSMTGWRIGWLLVPDDCADVLDALAGNLAICPPAPAQFAALDAFDAYDECDGHVRRYADQPGDRCSTGCAARASTGSRPPTAPSTSTPTSRT